MVCLCSSCEKLPTLAGWLPLGHACAQALQREQGTRVRSTGLRGIQRRLPKPSRTWPIPFPLEALTGAASSVMDNRKTLAFESIPKRDLCAQAVGSHCMGAAPLIWVWSTDMVSCSLVKNLPLHAGRCFRLENRTFLGNWVHSSPIRSCLYSSPLLTICTANCTMGTLLHQHESKKMAKPRNLPCSYSWSYAKSERSCSDQHRRAYW